MFVTSVRVLREAEALGKNVFSVCELVCLDFDIDDSSFNIRRLFGSTKASTEITGNGSIAFRNRELVASGCTALATDDEAVGFGFTLSVSDCFFTVRRLVNGSVSGFEESTFEVSEKLCNGHDKYSMQVKQEHQRVEIKKHPTSLRGRWGSRANLLVVNPVYRSRTERSDEMMMSSERTKQKHHASTSLDRHERASPTWIRSSLGKQLVQTGSVCLTWSDSLHNFRREATGDSRDLLQWRFQTGGGARTAANKIVRHEVIRQILSKKSEVRDLAIFTCH